MRSFFWIPAPLSASFDIRAVTLGDKLKSVIGDLNLRPRSGSHWAEGPPNSLFEAAVVDEQSDVAVHEVLGATFRLLWLRLLLRSSSLCLPGRSRNRCLQTLRV